MTTKLDIHLFTMITELKQLSYNELQTRNYLDLHMKETSVNISFSFDFHISCNIKRCSDFSDEQCIR